MKMTLLFEDCTEEEVARLTAAASASGKSAKIKKLPESDPEESEDEDEEDSQKSKKTSKSGSKSGASSSKTSKSKKPPVVEEDDEDEDEDEEDEDEDEDEDETPPKGFKKGKANLEGIKELASILADKGKGALTKKVLKEFGAAVVSKLDPADYIPVYSKLLKLAGK